MKEEKKKVWIVFFELSNKLECKVTSNRCAKTNQWSRSQKEK